MYKLSKYKLGLALIGGFSLILLVIVLVQASATKQDNQTQQQATEIADKLDTYVMDEGIPASLEEAGIRDVPETISYEKLSSTRYKFCVTYKTKSSGFDANSVWFSLATGTSPSTFEGSDDEESYYLYIPSTHDKGENCQTIKSFNDYKYDDSEFNDTFQDSQQF